MIQILGREICMPALYVPYFPSWTGLVCMEMVLPPYLRKLRRCRR